jgi:16S rRNA (cytosine967-C5)-methyltransferase
MSRYHSHQHTAENIIPAYRGEEPFSSFLKKYFYRHKKFGSKDRKAISQLCYCWFRLGKVLEHIPAEEQFLIAFFLCTRTSSELLAHLQPEWNEKISLSVPDKLSFLCISDSINKLFPLPDEVSALTDKTAFILSHLTQPDVFLQLRPGYEKEVKEKLKGAGIKLQTITDNCIALFLDKYAAWQLSLGVLVP